MNGQDSSKVVKVFKGKKSQSQMRPDYNYFQDKT